MHRHTIEEKHKNNEMQSRRTLFCSQNWINRISFTAKQQKEKKRRENQTHKLKQMKQNFEILKIQQNQLFTE